MYIRLGFRPNYGKRKRGGFLQVRDIMNPHVVSIDPTESAALAARLLARHNVGSLPVCGSGGQLQGMVTDRDLVTRCMAAGLKPQETPVAQVMTSGPITVQAEESAGAVSAIMGSSQVRRVPVLRNGKLAGIVSLADLARQREGRTERTLEEISSNISRR